MPGIIPYLHLRGYLCVGRFSRKTKTNTLIVGETNPPDEFRALKQPGFETPKHLSGVSNGGVGSYIESPSLWVIYFFCVAPLRTNKNTEAKQSTSASGLGVLGASRR